MSISTVRISSIHNFKVALQKLLKGDFIRAKVIFLGTLDSITQRKKFEEYIANELSLQK